MDKGYIRGLRVFLTGLAILATLSGSPAGSSSADSPFLFFDQVEVGMEGVAKVALKSDEPRTFNVRVVGKLDNPGTANDYILIRSTGDVIEEAGGYAQGMSGTPVYIDGKLIGGFFAIFSLFDKSTEPLGLVRPIEVMLELIPPLRAQAEALHSAHAGDGTAATAHEAEETAAPEIQWEGAPWEARFIAERWRDFLQEASTPLFVAGLGGRALRWLRRGIDREVFEDHRGALLDLDLGAGALAALQQEFLQSLQGGLEEQLGRPIFPMGLGRLAVAQEGQPEATPPSPWAARLEPGRPFGFMLSRGDITFGAFCTTTYVAGDTLLGCGHEFFRRGPSRLFLTLADYVEVVENWIAPFVVPEVGRSVGVLLEDRLQAVGGVLGAPVPDVLRLNIEVRDLDTDSVRSFHVEFAKDEQLLPTLLFFAGLQAVDETLNRIGPGTMQVVYELKGAGLARELERKDIFASFSDVAVGGPLRVAQVLLALLRNEFRDPKLEKVDIEIAVRRAIRTLRVKDLQTEKDAYRPGEVVRYAVVLQPYRGREVVKLGAFRLPEQINRSFITLHAFGGPRRARGGDNETPEFDDLDDLVTYLERLPGNDRLTVEILGLPRKEAEKAEAKSEEQEIEEESPFIRVEEVPGWVVFDEESVDIEIIKPEPEPEEAPEPEEPEQPSPPPCNQLFYC